ncbi:tol-pal system protein YbgF [Marinomonas sp. C2222]|uniref:Cell division coordinator CpoB n=1 Tax=Marinomonas sargassi TaxID=2984494 RepID=A0ABT2YSU3_9GAMM|nr:tol-pal system protein YbgF [Marinomonas sargassi]MCV2402964.1 tol-pal system protein YbgF [Marinomonas sargassi]
MAFKNVKLCSLAMVLSLTAPFALSESTNANSRGQISPDAIADLLFQLETLQLEVQSLRGQLEEQGHALKLMKASQRDRYIDLDKRLSFMMTSSVANSNSNSPTVAQTSIVESNQPVSAREQTSPVVQPVSTPVVVSSALAPAPIVLHSPTDQEKQAYSDAYNLIRERKFDESEVALSNFVEAYPDNTLTGNGYYWLGEVKLVQGKSEEAIKAFQTVLQTFPGHSKEPDVLYKLGTVIDQLGDTVKAKSYLQDVIKRFPDTSSASKAGAYLSKIK